MSTLSQCHRIVVKIGSSTLTHDEGHLNLRRIEALAKTLSDLKNAGKQVILVSSGAVSAGVARLGTHRPTCTREKQAMAAVGQSELMKLYSRFFADYGHTVAQMLLTKDVIDNPERRAAAEDTFQTLLEMGCIPIVNENDSVSTLELNFGGNDTLSAYVALVCHADLLINLSDVDGLFDRDPRRDPHAKLIPVVESLHDGVLAMAGGAGTDRGTGGMATKLTAARIALEAGIPMYILNGKDPHILYDLLDGKRVGTYFKAGNS
ncbi:MAG: glutamate 5-kinase [Ruminococcaceae bacterium]|nr:glutamate 5-kinase [Oscillospiraceae bacterium]